MIERCVVKIGSALLTRNGQGLDAQLIASLAADIARISCAGTAVVVVSSGAVAAGMARLGVGSRPQTLADLQALAAVGQMGLVQAYQSAFSTFNLQAAQVLLTHDDLADRQRYLNARATLRALLARGIVPVINENDTVATQEMCFGDNDNLAAVVCHLIESPLLIILTDQGGLFNKDPRRHADAQLIPVAPVDDPALDHYVGGSLSGLGRGGMITKLEAARQAARVGAATYITTRQSEASVLSHVFDPPVVQINAQGALAGMPVALERPLGTLLLPTCSPLNARKQWIAANRQLQGSLIVDQGAAKAVCEQGKSLLPVGLVSVSGVFQRAALVGVRDENGRTLAHGLVNYSSDELLKLRGVGSRSINEVLGYTGDAEAIHRDNLVLLR